jgi:hypothetical protein
MSNPPEPRGRGRRPGTPVPQRTGLGAYEPPIGEPCTSCPEFRPPDACGLLPYQNHRLRSLVGRYVQMRGALCPHCPAPQLRRPVPGAHCD